MPRGQMDLQSKHHHCYENWATRMWEPSKEVDDIVDVICAMTSWTHIAHNTLLSIVHGCRIEKEIRIPEG